MARQKHWYGHGVRVSWSRMSHHVWWAGRVFLDHARFALHKSCHIRLKSEVAHKSAGLVPCLENLVQFFTARGQAKNPRTNAAAALQYMNTNKRPVQS